MNTLHIYLKKINHNDKYEFKKKIQESFHIALSENFQNPPIIPSDEELEKHFNSSATDVYCIYSNDEKVGGAIVKINNETKINSLELFFIYKGKHSSGLGLSAWKEIEKLYPDTKVWKTVTPYFEKRNINFYVNKCGFKIVEFCNKYHKNQKYQPHEDNIPGEDDFFIFEKICDKTI
ncbi:MAG: GNAT family N-acetyltransferase [Candidatus Gastranaerophilaceae bacterium]